jgi:hypothetical protein
LPSALVALSGYRNFVLFVCGAALIIGVLTLVSTPLIAPPLQGWRYSYWIGVLAADAHRALGRQAVKIFGAACLMHPMVCQTEMCALSSWRRICHRTNGLDQPGADL